jgi:hypothetical protein
MAKPRLLLCVTVAVAAALLLLVGEQTSPPRLDLYSLVCTHPAVSDPI